MTIREGVARGAPKNIPPKKLLMVSGSLIDNVIQYEDGHFHCISNKIQWTFLYAELDFSRGIWAAARDGEEDRIKHLLSRFLNAATAHLSYFIFAFLPYVLLCSYPFTPIFVAAMTLSIQNSFACRFPSKGHRCQPERQWGLHWAALCSQSWPPQCCSPLASGVKHVSVSSEVGIWPSKGPFSLNLDLGIHLCLWTRKGLRWMPSPMVELPHCIVQPTRYLVLTVLENIQELLTYILMQLSIGTPEHHKSSVGRRSWPTHPGDKQKIS